MGKSRIPDQIADGIRPQTGNSNAVPNRRRDKGKDQHRYNQVKEGRGKSGFTWASALLNRT